MEPVGDNALIMNICYTIVSISSIIACIFELCGYMVPHIQLALSALVLRLAIRLVDIEGSLEKGYDR